MAQFLYCRIPAVTNEVWLALHEADKNKTETLAAFFKTQNLAQEVSSCTLFAYQNKVYTIDYNGVKIEESYLFSPDYLNKNKNELVADLLPPAAPDDFVLRAIAAAAGHKL